MTQEEFTNKWRPHILGWLTECWAARKLAPSEFGMLADRQASALALHLNKMFNDAQPKPSPNGDTRTDIVLPIKAPNTQLQRKPS